MESVPSTATSLTKAQRRAVAAVWLGWGFDVFDALLINFVAPNAIPTLLGLPIGTAAAKAATAQWTGILTALLLIGWAIGGMVFGHLADRIGRRRALILTIAVYAIGTGASALSPNIAVLIACRIVASLGIGGEFATGATLVAETVPESRRLISGAFLQTASPLGLILAGITTWMIAGVWMPDRPDISWRFVLAAGLVPIFIVLLLRTRAHEPEEKPTSSLPLRLALARLFSPSLRAATASAIVMSVLGLFTWWSCNAFLPTIGAGLGARAATAAGLTGAAAASMAESWKASITLWFNVGGVIGSLLTVPAARTFGRRGMFALYYAVSALSLIVTFGMEWPPETTLHLVFIVGLAVFGLFGAFAYYLPELFPPDVRGIGAGFSYNVGRLGAAVGPFLVGAYTARQADTTTGAMHALTLLVVLPLLAILATPFIVETRHRAPARLDMPTPAP
jgi:MFS family permease